MKFDYYSYSQTFKVETYSNASTSLIGSVLQSRVWGCPAQTRRTEKLGTSFLFLLSIILCLIGGVLLLILLLAEEILGFCSDVGVNSAAVVLK